MCHGRKFKYTGLEAGNQCFCSNSYSGLPTNSNQECCSASCAGNSSQICGGSWAIGIYNKSTPTETPIPSFGLSAGEKVGIAVGSVVGAALITTVSYYS